MPPETSTSPPGRARRPLPSPPLQLITGRWSSEDDLASRVSAALAGGIRWVQLRAKERSASELYAAACRLVPLVNEAGGLLVVNDRIDVAVAAGAAGVHLPENGMSAADARALLGSEAWIARSVHSGSAIRSAATDALDAVQFGPIFDTASKRDLGEPQGLDGLAAAARAAREAAVSLIAVGGITQIRVAACRDAGAAAVSVIGALWEAGDIEAASRRLIRSFG